MESSRDVGLSGVRVGVDVFNMVNLRFEVIIEGAHPVWDLVWVDTADTVEGIIGLTLEVANLPVHVIGKILCQSYVVLIVVVLLSSG